MDLTPAISTRYAEYLQTPQWRKTRNRALSQAQFRCRSCRGKRGLQVHHTTYDRLGAERDSDLEVLCGQCHSDRHMEAEKETPLGLYLKIGSEALHEHAYALVSDLADVMKTRCAQLKIAYDRHQIDKAIHLLLASNRLKAPKAVDTCVRPESPTAELTHEEAIAWLRRLNGGKRFDVPLPDMPEARVVRTHSDAFQVDRLKAAQIVAQEIADSIARCEALERELEAKS